MTRLMSLLLICAAFFAAGYPVHRAHADMLVMPPRVVFKDGERMKSITVANASTIEATYRMSFYHQRQTEEGGYVAVEAPENKAFDLAKMVVFSPRQVFLQPGDVQGVRLSLRRPESLPDGEYRVYVKVERMPTSENDKSAKGQRVGVGINISFAVPVMLRKGKYDTTAKISDVKYIPQAVEGKSIKPPRVEFYVNRTGKYSALGKAYVFWKPSGGEEKQVGFINKANVFAEVKRRLVSVNIPQNVSGGTFRVRFEGDDADKGIKFDEVTFAVP